MIIKEQALEAYNLLKDYCDEQDCCDDCLLCSVDDSCILKESPFEWQDLELD